MFSVRQVFFWLPLQSLLPGEAGRGMTACKSDNVRELQELGGVQSKRRMKCAGRGMWVLWVGYFKNIHLSTEGPCSEPLDPPHYIHTDITLPYPAFPTPNSWTLDNLPILHPACIQTWSLILPYIVNKDVQIRPCYFMLSYTYLFRDLKIPSAGFLILSG